VAIAPVVLLIGVVILPYIEDVTDTEAIAGKFADDPNRVAWGAIVLAISLGLGFLAVFAIRLHLKEAGEALWSFVAVPLIVLGGIAFALQAGMYLATAPIESSGGDVRAYLDDSESWIAPLVIAGGIVYGLGVLSLAVSVWRSKLLSQQLTWLTVAALVVSVVANFIPMGWAFYLFAVATLVGFWPVAYGIWGQSAPQATMQARPARP
jgi:hypothetical protein